MRLGLDESGQQLLLSPDLNHLSVWCEDFVVDFGNAALTCPGTTEASAMSPGSADPTGAPMATAPVPGAAGPGQGSAAPPAGGPGFPQEVATEPPPLGPSGGMHSAPGSMATDAEAGGEAAGGSDASSDTATGTNAAPAGTDAGAAGRSALGSVVVLAAVLSATCVLW